MILRGVSPIKHQLYDRYMDIILFSREIISGLPGVSITSEDLEKLQNIPSVKVLFTYKVKNLPPL